MVEAASLEERSGDLKEYDLACLGHLASVVSMIDRHALALMRTCSRARRTAAMTVWCFPGLEVHIW